MKIQTVRLLLRTGVPGAAYFAGLLLSPEAATSLFWVTAGYVYLITRIPRLEA